MNPPTDLRPQDPSPDVPEGARRVRWGTAATAAGSLGIAPRSDWSRWEADGRLPRSLDGSGFGVDFATDLELLAEHGLTTLRWTIDWSRLEPHPGRWDSEAVDQTTEVLRAARRAGVDVWAVLHDGPLPGWFADDQGGFADAEGRGRTWPRHVDRVAETFGDDVAGWVPVLDPYTLASDGLLHGRRPPGRQDEGAFLDGLEHLHRASFEAWRLLRSGESPVAACLDVAPVHAGTRTRHPSEREVAEAKATHLDRLRWGIWTRGLVEGLLSIPGKGEVEIPGLAGAYDVVGLTYRGAVTAYADDTTGPYPADAVVAADGHAPWTEGLGVTLRRLAEELPGRRLAVLGTGLVAREDDWRAEVVAGTAQEVARAVDDGVPVEMVLWETGIDGWVPDTGFDVPDGVIDRSRHPRPSAASLAAVASGRGMLGR